MKNPTPKYSTLSWPEKRHSYQESVRFLYINYSFLSLILTTVITWLLVLGDKKQYSVSSHYYFTLIKYRASVQIAVQIISASFGFFQQTAICQLFNYATRLRFERTPPTLDVIYTWNSISAARTAWGVRTGFFLPSIIFALSMLIPSALWAGAITPIIIVTQAPFLSPLAIPQFQNSTMIREWPSEIGNSGPLLRTSKGFFSFSPGIRLLGSLSLSAASATTVDGQIRQHPKFDNSRYTYNGRSYGVGSSVGLVDDVIASNPLALSYVYQETGLRADVKCIYNLSTEYVVGEKSETFIYPVHGNLPNSGDRPEEYSEFFGHNADAIVSIGVTTNNATTERILLIAAGKSYATLNATQCTINFSPKIFNVSVSLVNHSINVTEASDGIDFPASQNLTRTLTRQFELITNDQTSLYVAVLGDAFNSSIASYNSSIAAIPSAIPPSQAEATLAGITNSVTAMVDDLLVAYASAQLMIMNDSSLVNAAVEINAFRYGSGLYIYLTFAINIAIIVLLAEEALRTRGWRDLLYFDYTDPRTLIIGASMGGSAVSHAAKNAWIDRSKPLYMYDERGVGDIRVALHENQRSIVLDTSRCHQKDLPRIASRDDLLEHR